MYVRGYLQGSENGQVVTIADCWHSRHSSQLRLIPYLHHIEGEKRTHPRFADWHSRKIHSKLIGFVSLIMFTKIQIVYFQWGDKMKNCMYINRKRVTDWQRETYRSQGRIQGGAPGAHPIKLTLNRDFSYEIPQKFSRPPSLGAIFSANTYIVQGRIQDFKLGGSNLKKLRRAEGGAKNVGVLRVKNHDFTPKKSYFFKF